MKRFLVVLLCGLLLWCAAVPAFAEESSTNTETFPAMQVEVNAKAAVLMEANTGSVLMAANAHEQLFPASVTKIMTLLLVMEAVESGQIALTDTVTAGAEAVSKGGSQIWLEEGEQMTVDELIKAAAVASANDACEALGEYVAGSSTAFVKLMNERARELGMLDTNFENCTGLDDTTDTHKTSAYDIALMSRELLKHELIREYSTIWMDSLRGGETELVNTNRLVRFYDGITGLKTGTTSKAGCCVSATAERDGLELIAVVLGSDTSDDRFNGARAMLDWGFANYEAQALSVDKTRIPAVGVLGGTVTSVMPVIPEAQSVVLKKGASQEITQEIDMAAEVAAPVEKGQLLGRVYFKLDGETVYTCDLLCAEEIPQLTLLEAFRRALLALCG